jgi:HEAT repeat protein
VHRDAEVRSRAAKCLGALNIESEQAIDALIQFLADRDDFWNPRSQGIEALTRIGSAATDKLISALEADDVMIRAGAAEVLGRIEPSAKEAVAPLAEALTDARMPVRRNAAKALGQLGFDARSALPSLKKALQDEFQSVREQAEAALADIAKRSMADK